MIDLQGVTKTYPNGVCALDGVDLHIEKGEFVFVVGHSGAGKSTLIKTLLREEVPTAGEVTVNGRDLIRMKQREIPYFRRTIGVVFQDFRLIPTMTVFDNVAFALRGGLSGGGCPISLTCWGWMKSTSTIPRSFPAVSSSVWRWPAPLSITPTC